MIKLARHHQAIINALAAFTRQVLEHNDADLNSEDADVQLSTFVGLFGVDLKDFMKEYGYDVRIRVRPIKDWVPE